MRNADGSLIRKLASHRQDTESPVASIGVLVNPSRFLLQLTCLGNVLASGKSQLRIRTYKPQACHFHTQEMIIYHQFITNSVIIVLPTATVSLRI